MSTVENIDSILDVPYGELSKKEIEYCISVISMKKHEVIYNTSALTVTPHKITPLVQLI